MQDGYNSEKTNFGRKVNKIINQRLLRENATSQSHKTLAVSLAKRAKKDVNKMTTELKLKIQAKSIRQLIVTLDNLIDSTEMPIKLKVEIVEGHKNLNTVWKEIGVIPLNQ